MCEDQQKRRQKQGGREAFYLARQSMKTSGSGPGRGCEKSTPWMSLSCSRYQTSKGSCELAYPSKTRGISCASKYTTVTSPCGVCWREAKSLVIPRRLLAASYSLRRGPTISWQKRFHCSVFPGRIGKTDANDAICFSPFLGSDFRAGISCPVQVYLPYGEIQSVTSTPITLNRTQRRRPLQRQPTPPRPH